MGMDSNPIQTMATLACKKPLAVKFKKFAQNPEKCVIPQLDLTNIMHCCFVLLGAPDTLYDGGMYFGLITIPTEYPFLPPSIEMCTPSGRFAPNKRIYIAISDFH